MTLEVGLSNKGIESRREPKTKQSVEQRRLGEKRQ